METAGSLALGGGMLGGFRPSRAQPCFVEFDDLQFPKILAAPAVDQANPSLLKPTK
jgi:hypothetical protein